MYKPATCTLCDLLLAEDSWLALSGFRPPPHGRYRKIALSSGIKRTKLRNASEKYTGAVTRDKHIIPLFFPIILFL